MKLNARIVILILTAVALSIAAACSSSSARSNNKKGPNEDTANNSTANDTPAAAKKSYPLPNSVIEAEMKTIDGKKIKLSDYKGKVLIVNQWATWCGPCRMEIPALMKIREEYKDQGFEIIGLTIEDDRGNVESAIKSYAENQKITYPIVLASEEIWQEFSDITGKYAIPQSFIVNRNGEVTAAFSGFNPARTPANVRKAVEAALNQ